MKHDFRDIGREDKVNKNLHVELWNKYLAHIYSSANTLSKVSELASIHQFVLSNIAFRFDELKASFVAYFDFFFEINGYDDADAKEYFVSRISRERYVYLFTQLYIIENRRGQFDGALNLLNDFVTHLLFKREINVFVEVEELDQFGELKKTLDFNNLIENLNLYIQDRKHSLLINELLHLYFNNELEPHQDWDNLSETVKDRITSEGKPGRNPYEEYPQEKVLVYTRKCIRSKEYIWNTPKKKGQYKKAKIADELLNEVFGHVESPLTQEAMITRVNKAIQEIEKTK